MKRYHKKLIKSTFVWDMIQYFKLNSFKRKWIRANRHNDTVPNTEFDMDTVKVGNYSYGELNVVSFNNRSKLIIGNFVSIAQNVVFLLDVEHYTNHISTFPFRVKALNTLKDEAHSKGDIIVEDDVWIGYGATIVSGVRIGKGAVIAAGAVVTKNVPEYTIVGGVPAKVLKKRFADNIASKLSSIDYKDFSLVKIESCCDCLYTAVNENNVDALVDKMNSGEKYD